MKKATPVLFTLLVALPLGLFHSPAFSSVDDFEFESFDAIYVLGQDDGGHSRLETTETLVALFPEVDQNRGLARELATDYLGRPLNTTVLDVTNGAGEPRDWSAAVEGEALVVESVVPPGDYVRGRQVYEIRYHQDNVVGDFGDSTGFQEFYWDINGTGWPQRFGRVSAEVLIGSALAGSLVAGAESCYQGTSGSTLGCEITRYDQPDGGVRFVATAGPLAPYETMTLALAFQPETFVVPPPNRFSLLGLSVQILALLGAVWFWVWALILRRGPLADAAGRPVIIPEYLPPRGVNIGQATLLRKVVNRLPLASLLELAVSGKAALGEDPVKHKRWSLIQGDQELTSHDKEILMVLFGRVPEPGERVALPRQSTQVAQRLSTYLTALQKSLKEQGLVQTVGASTRVLPIAGAGLSLAGALLGVVLGEETGVQGALHWGLGALIVGIASWALGWLLRTPLASAGAEARDYLEGLKMYIRLAEKDRLEVLQSPQGALRQEFSPDNPTEVLKLYEDLLPWAVVLGEEKRWVAQLSRLYQDQDPRWISGNGAHLVGAMNSLNTATTSSFGASSRGGSGGGGSAGGGGGGGGGGGR